jgi:hypothetical protein
MSDKKYSVFISSTFDDLQNERSAVLIELAHAPATAQSFCFVKRACLIAASGEQADVV